MRLDDDVAEWTVVMPVKSLAAAKSRLAHAVAPSDLALAFLLDTLGAVLRTPGVTEALVVTSDLHVTSVASGLGARVVDDVGHPGINAAASWGMSHGMTGTRAAVVVSDLPCLTPEALSLALASADPRLPSFVPDLEGVGTAIWMSGADGTGRPQFGTASRDAHAAAGDVDLIAVHPQLTAALAPARCDIDTADALDAALGIGVGPATATLLDR